MTEMEAAPFYIMPTEENSPPRALLNVIFVKQDDGTTMMGGEAMAIWTADMGTWTVAGVPLPQEIGDAMTEYAKELGVEGW